MGAETRAKIDFSMAIEVREPRNRDEYQLYYDLRWRILREPWNLSRQSAQDDHEAEAFHIVAFDDGGRLLGVGRLHSNLPEEGQVRYMAVDNGYQNRGIGGLILEKLEMRAREQGFKRIVLNARENAIPFYEKHGFCLIGKTSAPFEPVVHWRMEKLL